MKTKLACAVLAFLAISALAHAQVSSGGSGVVSIGAAIPTGANTIGAVNVNNTGVGSAAVATGQVTAGTDQVLVAAARTGAPGVGRISITVYNAGSVAVCFGPTGVTTATGVCLAAGASMMWNTQAAIYGISGLAAQTVNFVELY